MERWTLEDLIDLEQAILKNPVSQTPVKATVANSIAGKAGADARRVGLKIWLALSRQGLTAGRRFSRVMVSLGVGLWLFGGVAGGGMVSSLMQRDLGGLNVVIFMALVIGLQWLVLVTATILWAFRRKAAGGWTGFQSLIGGVIRKLTGEKEDGWWVRIADGGSEPRAALLWRVASIAQGFGIGFNLGVILTLTGFVFARNVAFFWETTTDQAMRGALGQIVGILSLPWASFWPAAVPDAATIDATRLLAGKDERLAAGPEAWWLFLVAATFVWGLLPRVVLWLQAGSASKRALAKLDFQARHHRALWRELTGTTRAEVDEKPQDGVLVLDVGGSGLKESALRPFLLQKLRVNPAAWHSIAVLDPGAERQAREALAMAPAGVVLLAEGWALSPPRMKSLHSQIRELVGQEAPVKFFVVNQSGEDPAAPTSEEKIEWERFVDSLRDPNAEVFCYGSAPASA
jgi:hypothetical protein